MNLEAQVAAAVADLAERTGVAPGSIETLEARHVTWPDASLGCPLPELMYMQVLTPGTLIRLRAAGVEYRYHARTGGGPLLCPAAQATEPVPGAVDR